MNNVTNQSPHLGKVQGSSSSQTGRGRRGGFRGRTFAALGLAAALSLGTLAPTVGSSAGGFGTATALASGFVAAQNSDPTTAIEQIIQQSNTAQAQAIASGNPSVMQSTATASYYQQLLSINQQLAGSGVTSISLANVQWGAVTINGSTATAADTETWVSNLNDGTVDEAQNQNVYTLVQQGGTWLIQSDSQPASSANPATGGSGSTSPVPVPVPQAPSSSTGLASSNWAGYQASSGAYTAVSGTWTVPAYSVTTSGGVDATWVGIGGVKSNDLVQAGTQETASGTGDTQYSAWLETLPQAAQTVPLSVHPGDTISVSLTEQSGSNWVVLFTNRTTGQTYQTTVQYTSSNSSAEWIEEAPSSTGGSILPLDSFGSVTFSAGSAVKNGQTVSIQGAGASAITMTNRGSQALATTSALTADGSGFTVTRSAATAVPQPTAPATRGRRGGSTSRSGSSNGFGLGTGSGSGFGFSFGFGGY